ncbi:MAG: lactate utilization protein [Eubacterium sp.]
MENYIAETIKNLERNNFMPYYVETKEEVVPLIKTLINKGDSLSNGGSETIKECGVFEQILESGDYNFIDRRGLEGEAIRQSYIAAYGCDTYICSSNAVTQRGELYNVDGNSNRVSCIVYGPRQVIIVVGKNKIVPDINSAMERVKTTAAPPNCVRLDCATPCSKTGHCISLDNPDSYICDGCGTDARICCNYVVSARQRHKDRIKVIIVNESLGY